MEWEEVELLAGVKTPPLPSPSETEGEGGAVGGAAAAAENVEESNLSATSWTSASAWTTDEPPTRPFRRHWRAPFACCGRAFPTEEDLLQHYGRLTNSYRARCLHKKCGLWFDCPRALRNHQVEKNHKGVAFFHEGRLRLGEIPLTPLPKFKDPW